MENQEYPPTKELSTNHNTDEDSDLASAEISDPIQDFWSPVVLWISMAEALLPFTVYLVAVLLQLILWLGGLTEFPNSSILVGIGSLALGCTVLFCLTMILGAFITCCIHFVVKSLNASINNILGGACVGGFIGMLIVLPFYHSPMLRCYVLPIATVLGQIGGAWGAWKALLRNARPSSLINASSGQEKSALRHAVKPAGGPCPKRWQFSIRQMLIFTAWTAILLSFLKTAQLLNSQFLIFCGLWLILQLLALPVISYADRRARQRIYRRVPRETNS